MRCLTYLLWLALLGVMAGHVWGSERLAATSRTNGVDSETPQLTVNPYSAYQESIWRNFWNLRYSPQTALPAESHSGRNYDDDDDDDDDDDYGHRGGSSYVSPIIQPIQLPQAQSYQPNYYGYQQQPSFSTYLPLSYPSGGGHKKKKKKKKSNPVCCCATTACLETCNPTSFTPPSLCTCYPECCDKYAATNPGCATLVPERSKLRSAFFNKALYRKKLDEIVDRYLEKYDDEAE